MEITCYAKREAIGPDQIGAPRFASSTMATPWGRRELARWPDRARQRFKFVHEGGTTTSPPKGHDAG